MPSIAHRPPSPLYVGRPRRHRRQRGNSGAARSKVATPCGPRSSCGPCCPRGSKGRARRRRTLLRRRSGWPRSPRSAGGDRSPPDRARPRPCRSRNSSGTAAGLDAPPPWIGQHPIRSNQHPIRSNQHPIRMGHSEEYPTRPVRGDTKSTYCSCLRIGRE